MLLHVCVVDENTRLRLERGGGSGTEGGAVHVGVIAGLCGGTCFEASSHEGGQIEVVCGWGISVKYRK